MLYNSIWSLCVPQKGSQALYPCGRLELTMKFTDESCFSCGSKFEEKDDVVVCPQCGTPYHRECYNLTGECINTQLHESGEKWKRELAKEQNSAHSAGPICPNCMNHNEENAEICTNCGCRLSATDSAFTENENGIGIEIMTGSDDNPFLKPYLGFNPDEDLGGATLKEVSEFVYSNTLYYIPLFKKMKDFGTKASLNIACFLFPYFYFANRKMWFWGILTAIISIILELPATLHTLATAEMDFPYIQDVITAIASKEKLLLAMSEVCAIASWIFRLVVCTFANWLYFRFAVKSIKRIKAACGGTAEPSRLRAAGGINPPNMLSMLLIVMGISLAISFILLTVLSVIQQVGF